MQKSTKVIVTIIAIVIWLFLSVINTGMRSDVGHSTPGFLGLILLLALIGALRAIWKKRDDDSDNSTMLQK